MAIEYKNQEVPSSVNFTRVLGDVVRRFFVKAGKVKMKVSFRIMFPGTVLFSVQSTGQQHQLHSEDHEKYCLGPTLNLLSLNGKKGRREGEEGERMTCQRILYVCKSLRNSALKYNLRKKSHTK